MIKNKFRKAYLTYAIILINIAIFCLENILGGSEIINFCFNHIITSRENFIICLQNINRGSENLENLEYLGALIPQKVWAGQWWRILTANLLHYGWIHLVSNLLSLYFLGRFIELYWGRWQYFLIYLMSGIGSMLSFTFLAMRNEEKYVILLGASASIMGLVGATLALFLKLWLQQRTRLATRRLYFVGLIILFQSIFDIWMPQVSFYSHFFGMLWGFLVGTILLTSFGFRTTNRQ